MLTHIKTDTDGSDAPGFHSLSQQHVATVAKTPTQHSRPLFTKALRLRLMLLCTQKDSTTIQLPAKNARDCIEASQQIHTPN
ncbi:hypothetical protein QL285_005875 [Trifolium repens]|nr:hypothetical protein QL285_005875 [Trifolium repens]